MQNLNKTAGQILGKLEPIMPYMPLIVGAGLIALAACAPDVYAGDGGQEFDDVWQTLKDWTQGTLGKIISIALVLVGIVFGVARQSLIAFAICIAGAMGLYNAPTIIEALLTKSVGAASDMVQVLPNLPL